MGVATQTAVTSFRPDELDVVLAAFEAAAESLLVVENDLILLANPACVKLFGCEQLAALVGQPLNQFFPPNRFCHELFHSSPNGNQSNHCEHPSYELTVLRPDGSEVRVSARCTLFVYGNRSLVLAALHEADRKRSEEHLREAEKMEVIGRLAGGVAHDFNNLLTGILLYCDLLLHELDPGNRVRQHVEEVRLAGEQGAALTQQLLAIARKQAPQPRPILLNQVVASTENLLRRLIGEHIELVTFLGSDLGTVLADQAQLRQVILNLALNARDAMPHGGRITVRTHGKTLPGTSQPAVALVVEDTGCGMDASTRARLFEPFFTTKQPGCGTGLGLATVQRIVKEAGGVIAVESEPGRGTRIEVLLPATLPTTVPTALPTMPSLSEASAPAAIPDAIPNAIPNTIPNAIPNNDATILLVDDNASARKSMHRVLRYAGYRVLGAHSGKRALAVFAGHSAQVDLLIADSMMPGMGGLELVEKIRRHRPDLKVLLISGYHDAPVQNPSGAPVALIRKPFAGTALIAKIREVLNSTGDPQC